MEWYNQLSETRYYKIPIRMRITNRGVKDFLAAFDLDDDAPDQRLIDRHLGHDLLSHQPGEDGPQPLQVGLPARQRKEWDEVFSRDRFGERFDL